MILETERLILREMVPSDAEDMLRLHSHPEVQQYTGDPTIFTFEGIQDKIQEKTDEYRKYGYGRWVTFLKEGMQFVGWAGLSYLPEFDEIDLGHDHAEPMFDVASKKEECEIGIEGVNAWFFTI